MLCKSRSIPQEKLNDPPRQLDYVWRKPSVMHQVGIRTQCASLSAPIAPCCGIIDSGYHMTNSQVYGVLIPLLCILT